MMILFMFMILRGIKHAFFASKWLALAAILMVSGIAFACNFIMAADSMFKQPGTLVFKKFNG